MVPETPNRITIPEGVITAIRVNGGGNMVKVSEDPKDNSIKGILVERGVEFLIEHQPALPNEEEIKERILKIIERRLNQCYP